MALAAAAIAQGVVDQLHILDPVVSAEIGTPERKIIEATAELFASQQVDFTVLNTQHDLSRLSGGRLDAYLSIFNFGRGQAAPSFGSVTFQRNTLSTTQIVIPRGTQLQANIDSTVFPSLTFVTTDAVVLEQGSSSVSVNAQCTVAGTIGNIDANKIVGFAGLQSIAGISSVTNNQGFSAGVDAETDDVYRARFQNGFLRNISGTTDMFLALAVAANGITKANVLGPLSRYQEYVLIPAADDTAQHTTGGSYDPAGTIWPHKRTTAKSAIPYSKYTYPVNYYLTDSTLDPATAKFYRPGVDYVLNTPPVDASSGSTQVNTTPASSPNVTILATSDHGGNPGLTPSTTLLLEHAYISTHSRNDNNFGIFNCVDVFVNGQNEQLASSVEVVPSGQILQNSNAGSWTYQLPGTTNNYTRKLDSVPSAVGSIIQPLFWQPVLDVPDSLTIGTSTYYKANFYNSGNSTYYNQFDGVTYSFKAHYIFVEETSALYGTIRSRNGIEWFQSGSNHLVGQLPTDSGDSYSGGFVESQTGTQFTVPDYSFDQNISDLQAVMEKNKQTTQDVLVHRTRWRYFQPIVTIMYNFGVTQSVVNATIITALDLFFQNQYYGTAIQLSDILQTIHNVPGVDNVKFTNPTGNKVQEVSQSGAALATPVFFTTDFFIQDSELAAAPDTNAVVITTRSANTWG